MKEFSQKYSEVFFYSTIVLSIICIILAFNLIGNKNQRPRFDGNQVNGGGRMMQNGGNDFGQIRRLGNVKNQTTDNNTGPVIESGTATPTTNEVVN